MRGFASPQGLGYLNFRLPLLSLKNEIDAGTFGEYSTCSGFEIQRRRLWGPTEISMGWLAQGEVEFCSQAC